MSVETASSAQTQPDEQRAGHDVFSAGGMDDGNIPDCQSCGACCSYSAEWPRFTTESDEVLDLIPPQYVAADERGMRWEDGRCSALCGRVGESTSCVVYNVRPEVCRECTPGDYACTTARAAFGLK